MNQELPPGSIHFAYDPIRGGFLLRWGGINRNPQYPLCGGLLHVFLNARGRIAAIESFFASHGGLPLNDFHHVLPSPTETYSIEGDELRAGAFRLHQSPRQLTLWFSQEAHLPCEKWKRVDEPAQGMTVWFSDRRAKAGWPVPGVGGRAECDLLAGFSVELARTELQYPIRWVTVAAEDFK